jgi:ketosteroid isomerase-like protein
MRVTACSLVVLCGLLVAGSTIKAEGAGASAASGVEKALIQMEKDWANAGITKDAATMERVIADDWVGVDYNGKTLSKAEAIADLKSGASAAKSIELGQLKVRVYGNTAVVNGSDTEKSTWKGKDSSGHYVWTDVFVERNGKWQAVSSTSVKTK